MENPYEAPKTIERSTTQSADLFECIIKCQRRLFYAGIVVAIIAIFIPMKYGTTREIITLFGVAAMFISIGSILPVVIWGFFKGYGEGKK